MLQSLDMECCADFLESLLHHTNANEVERPAPTFTSKTSPGEAERWLRASM